jgi:hypothetical protein
LAPLELTHEVDSFQTVNREDLLRLASPSSDPFAALVTLAGGNELPPGLLICEPALCSRVLASLWRSVRNEGAPLTQVEAELLRGFLTDIVRSWRGAWREEQISITPTLALAGTLTQLSGQMAAGNWHIARTVVREVNGDTVGVLLFCFPALALPRLAVERDRIRWRSRLGRGLTEAERQELRSRLSTTLSDVRINVPVSLRTDVPLGVINSLERGDVVTLDASQEGFELKLLDAPVTAVFARTGENFALVLTGPGEDAAPSYSEYGEGEEDPYGDFDPSQYDPSMTGE